MEECPGQQNLCSISLRLGCLWRRIFNAVTIKEFLFWGTHESDHRHRQSDSIVLCFDLENVIPCPRAEVSNFFYKRKIKVII
jgi:hypothetical protein